MDDGSRYFLGLSFGNGEFSKLVATTWVVETKSGHFLQFGYPLDGSAGPSRRPTP
jgi:hypothetical protein